MLPPLRFDGELRVFEVVCQRASILNLSLPPQVVIADPELTSNLEAAAG
jgi:hypothetical protein